MKRFLCVGFHFVFVFLRMVSPCVSKLKLSKQIFLQGWLLSPMSGPVLVLPSIRETHGFPLYTSNSVLSYMTRQGSRGRGWLIVLGCTEVTPRHLGCPVIHSNYTQSL